MLFKDENNNELYKYSLAKFQNKICVPKNATRNNRSKKSLWFKNASKNEKAAFMRSFLYKC